MASWCQSDEGNASTSTQGISSQCGPIMAAANTRHYRCRNCQHPALWDYCRDDRTTPFVTQAKPPRFGSDQPVLLQRDRGLSVPFDRPSLWADGNWRVDPCRSSRPRLEWIRFLCLRLGRQSATGTPSGFLSPMRRVRGLDGPFGDTRKPNPRRALLRQPSQQELEPDKSKLPRFSSFDVSKVRSAAWSTNNDVESWIEFEDRSSK